MRVGETFGPVSTTYISVSAGSKPSAAPAAVTLLDPRRIVVGGGLARAGGFLLEPLEAALDARLTFEARPQVVPAALGHRAGGLGAGLLALETYRARRCTRSSWSVPRAVEPRVLRAAAAHGGRQPGHRGVAGRELSGRPQRRRRHRVRTCWPAPGQREPVRPGATAGSKANSPRSGGDMRHRWVEM
ncbi:ROK family protein [Streptacidiphilus sp. MAP12-20]|uniref:ROK family protein n=1 Tax=Streptacidiphilus sp. MAP12-20 TaxID=3156299 RepID=UPI0035140652